LYAQDRRRREKKGPEGGRLRPLRELPGWKTSISGRWRRPGPPRKGLRAISIGWPHGEKVGRSGMSTWGAAGRWITIPPCRRLGR